MLDNVVQPEVVTTGSKVLPSALNGHDLRRAALQNMQTTLSRLPADQPRLDVLVGTAVAPAAARAPTATAPWRGPGAPHRLGARRRRAGHPADPAGGGRGGPARRPDRAGRLLLDDHLGRDHRDLDRPERVRPALSDPIFWRVIENNALLLLSIPFAIGIPLAIAALLHEHVAAGASSGRCTSCPPPSPGWSSGWSRCSSSR